MGEGIGWSLEVGWRWGERERKMGVGSAGVGGRKLEGVKRKFWCFKGGSLEGDWWIVCGKYETKALHSFL